MKLKTFTEDAMELLQHNVDANVKYYQKPSNLWIYDFIENEEDIRDFYTDVPDFELIFDKNDTSKSDIENVKTVYSNLKFLTNEQASDNRLWTGITHLNFWEFMHNRWEVGEKGQNANNIKGRYFIEMSSSYRRSLIVNTISKYWWVGKKLYDEDADDPFYLLKYFESDYSTRTFNLLSSSFANNDEIIRFTVESLVELEQEIERRLVRKEYIEIMRYLNILGGINVLDYFIKMEFKEKIKKRFYKEIKV